GVGMDELITADLFEALLHLALDLGQVRLGTVHAEERVTVRRPLARGNLEPGADDRAVHRLSHHAAHLLKVIHAGYMRAGRNAKEHWPRCRGSGAMTAFAPENVDDPGLRAAADSALATAPARCALEAGRH